MTHWKERLIKFPILRPKASLFLGFLLFILVAPFSLNIGFDFSAQAWLSDNDSHIEALNDFERTFGSDERVIFLVELKEKDVFDESSIKLLQDLTSKMWLVPDVVRVESLTNFNWSYADGDDLVTEAFIPDQENLDSALLEQRKEDALEHKVIPGIFLSKNMKSAIVYGRLGHDPDASLDAQSITLAAEEIVESYKDNPDFKLHLLGDPILSFNFQRISFEDLAIMTPFLFLIVILYLAFTYRSYIGVVIPMTIILSSVGFTIGLIGLLGIKINSLTFVLPSILMAISIADAVHLLTTFFSFYSKGEKLQDSIHKSMEKNFYPIFLTSLSTAIGFFSLTVSNIVPVSDLGVLAGIGTLSAMFFSYFFVPPLLMLFMSRYAKSNRPLNQRILPRALVEKYVLWVEKRKIRIILASTLVMIGGTYLGLQNKIDSNPFEYFSEDEEITIANQYTLENYGGVGGPEIVIDSGEVDGVKNPDFLLKVDSFEQWLKKRDYVNNVMSIIGVLKEVNQALYQGKESEYKINESREVIAQELFLYTMGLPQGMDINNRVDLAQQKVRLSVLWELQSSTESLEKIKEIEQEGKRRGLDLNVTGKAVLFQRMNNHVVYTFFSSIALALIIITFLLIYVFKSVRIGLLSLIPNFVPIVLGAALLTLLKIPIDIGCAIVASVTLGIAVDDTIHFLSHYNKLIKEGVERVQALTEVIATTGLALLVTSMILASCFGIFMLASLTPNINFGVLCAFVISMALICDLIMIPAAILCFKKAS